MSVPQIGCPSCGYTTPAWRNDCIHCGFVRNEVAPMGRTYPVATDPDELIEPRTPRFYVN